MQYVTLISLIAAMAGNTWAMAVEKRDTTTATVTLSADKGAPSHLVSGMLYGVPDTPDQVPDQFYTGMGFNYLRAGGAQNPAPGWIGGVDAYRARFQSALLNYQTAREHGARFQLLPHDLWGADSLQPDDAPFPGDNGDWSSYDQFLDTLVSDLKSNDMTDGLDIDIWNEPDNSPFWARSQEQYLETWARSYSKYRTALGTSVPLVGPSTVSQPTTDSDWWKNYLSFISSNSSVPDHYSWHLLLDSNNPNVDPEFSSQTFNSMRGTYNLPAKGIVLNEFALREEQQPAGAVWYIARFERNNVRGLRANYLFYGALHDFFAGLLGKLNADSDNYDPQAGGYWANGEWQLLKYYASMTGRRVATTGTSDKKFEVYATKSGNSFKIIAGARLVTGTWNVKINGLSSVGKPKSGTVSIRTRRFDFNGYFGQVGDPVDLGVKSYKYAGDSLTIKVTPKDQNTAYAFELA